MRDKGREGAEGQEARRTDRQRRSSSGGNVPMKGRDESVRAHVACGWHTRMQSAPRTCGTSSTESSPRSTPTPSSYLETSSTTFRDPPLPPPPAAPPPPARDTVECVAVLRPSSRAIRRLSASSCASEVGDRLVALASKRYRERSTCAESFGCRSRVNTPFRLPSTRVTPCASVTAACALCRCRSR